MQLSEVIHYYIGQKFSYANMNYSEPLWSPWDILTVGELKNIQDFATENISFRLALRPLESMTEEERISGNVWSCNPFKYPSHPTGFYSPMEFIYLLSKGFDLFGLIESGQAIDSTQTIQDV